MPKNKHSEAVRASWLVYVIKYTSDLLDMSVTDTVALLDEYGFTEKILNGYPAFHTQGFEYMAEFIVGELQKVQGVRV